MGSHPTLDQHQLAAEALESDPDDWIHDHHHRPAERTSEQAFDQLNPEFGVPADRSDRIGHRDVQQREAALALGVRVANWMPEAIRLVATAPRELTQCAVIV